MANISIHWASKIKMRRRHPAYANANAFTLEVVSTDYLGHESQTAITIFGLPREAADAISDVVHGLNGETT